jgi:hypothetical protein
MAVPAWVYIGVAIMVGLAGVSGLIDRSKEWGKSA